jgi:hypothetical protein
MFPASRSGTSRMLARPATGEVIPLICAAAGLMALSSANGPSTTPPLICPRSAILLRIAASQVVAISRLIVSTADRTATRGCSMPRPSARSIAFWTMSTLVLRSGAMFTAASVTSSGSG